jgi:hypothetical protein
VTVQLTGHDFLKKLGIALIPATAPDFFTEDTPTAVLVRQVLGAIAQFEKTSLVGKLKASRDRKKAATGKCEGHRSYAESKPETVALAKELHGRRMSLRQIAAELAARGHLTAYGKPSHSPMALMLPAGMTGSNNTDDAQDLLPLRPCRARRRLDPAARADVLAVRFLSARPCQGLHADQEPCRRHGANTRRGSADRHGRRRLIFA